jgi:hypothetical protein
MRARRFAWEGAGETAAAIRGWAAASLPNADVTTIGNEIRDGGDEAVLRLTARFDATESPPQALRVDPGLPGRALAGLEPGLRESLELAAENVRAVAEAQPAIEPRRVDLPQGQSVTLRELAVGAAGIYAPGGKAAYPSSVLMGAIPARAAGVERVVLASPPGPNGELQQLVLAAAALCEISEVYAMGARITLCDPHRAIVSGPSRLHGERVESPDIRAGMAMLIAALAAKGTSEIGNIRQIDRGYESIDERLRGLGARIERVSAEIPA